MATWTTNDIALEDFVLYAAGSSDKEWWRYLPEFDAEIPEGSYVHRILGNATLHLDPISLADVEVSVGIRTAIGGNPVIATLSPGQTGTFPIEQVVDPVVGPLGQWDTVLILKEQPLAGDAPTVRLEVSNITVRFVISNEPPGPGPDPDPEGPTAYNCACDDDYPRSTLGEMRNRIATRLGFATQVAMGILPPGMAPLLDDFIRSAQEMLYQRYSVFRMERFYIWNMEPGVRFYDFDANADACPKRMDPRMVTWVGISQGDLSWRPLVCGIDPVMYGSPGPGIPSHYEIRQCIEVWPAPVDDTWKLRIKGHFGLLPLEADSDETTIDPEAIFLQALANAKAHYGQPDAGNYAAQAAAYVRSLVAGSHHTRRYIPGSAMPPPAVRPVLKED